MTTLSKLHQDAAAREIINRARRREARAGASGDTLDFALLVVDECRRAAAADSFSLSDGELELVRKGVRALSPDALTEAEIGMAMKLLGKLVTEKTRRMMAAPSAPRKAGR